MFNLMISFLVSCFHGPKIVSLLLILPKDPPSSDSSHKNQRLNIFQENKVTTIKKHEWFILLALSIEYRFN